MERTAIVVEAYEQSDERRRSLQPLVLWKNSTTVGTILTVQLTVKSLIQ